MKKKILSMLLAVVMLLSVLPMSAISAYATAWSSASGTVQVTQLRAGDYLYKGTKLGGNTWMFTIDGSYKFGIVNVDKCYYVVSASTGNARVELKSQHDYAAATCTTAKKCKGCATTSGSALGHDYTNYRDGGQATAATCTTAATHYKMCSRCTSKSGTYSYGSALGHSYTVYQSVSTAATCTADRVDNYKCSRCTATTTKTATNTKLGHTYTKQGSKVSDATVDSPAIYNKQCERCTATSGTMQVGDKLPSMKVSYLDPITNETVDLGEATNDNAEEAVNTLMKRPMQKENNIFLGWVDENEDAINKNATRFDALTNIHANFLGLGYMQKDMNDEKLVDGYMTFGLAGVQIREDRTQEHSEYGDDLLEGQTYGGLRFVASFADSVFNSLNVIEYGFVVATKDNAKANATASGDAANYVIKNGDKGVRRIKCSDSVDHRRFYDNYRLFTMVIDYEGNEGLKGTEFVARPYIAYRDANGVNRIFYGSYDGTVTYGGCSTSYNNASVM